MSSKIPCDLFCFNKNIAYLLCNCTRATLVLP